MRPIKLPDWALTPELEEAPGRCCGREMQCSSARRPRSVPSMWESVWPRAPPSPPRPGRLLCSCPQRWACTATPVFPGRPRGDALSSLCGTEASAALYGPLQVPPLPHSLPESWLEELNSPLNAHSHSGTLPGESLEGQAKVCPQLPEATAPSTKC